MVPDFKKCKKEHMDYANFIDKFADSFDKCLETVQIVPVPQGIALINSVILDTTGLSTSGIMTDEEFRRFTGKEEYYLPLPMLRQDKNFCSFLKHYANDEQRFDKEELIELIANKDFQKWLQIQDNNNKFLKFLLDKGYLEDLMGEEIFLESGGGLYCASELYYDIDTYLEDLQAFTNHICYITPNTRDFLRVMTNGTRLLKENSTNLTVITLLMLFCCLNRILQKLKISSRTRVRPYISTSSWLKVFNTVRIILIYRSLMIKKL